MNSEERNSRIYYEHKNGRTHLELGQKYGLSSQVIRRIVKKEEENVMLASDEIFSLLTVVCNDKNLVIRMYKVLRRAGINTREQFVSMDRETYKKFRGIGDKSVLVIESAQRYCQV